ncbi:MAG: asparagine synthase (glutamine-hydrolyzing) [Betaproteobacteria bacterium]|nr:MAG: asparagine synthase (glutamine-hydrolyzing) [Betaproteobacteria bacterium]
MCGICGFTGASDRSALERMTESLRHRGPDGSGFHVDASVSLGMRRLAIVDLETGGQPAYNEDRSICVVFNGEIYNHAELRRLLEARGHRFRSDHSDTEVLVHLYEEYGADYLHQLNGMFAIVLWDSGKRELHLARDRAGVKPLYLRQHAGRLWFASEPKGILAHPDVVKAPNFAALTHYFSLKNIPAPWSAFDGIEQLRAGERAVFREGELKRTRWWRISFAGTAPVEEAGAAAEIRRLLEDSVRLRMQCDVPFGAYLSGGLDSSSVVALMSRQSAAPIKTFSLTYERDYMLKDSDREYARRVSTQYGTEHREHVMTQRELVDGVESVLGSFDEPFSGVTSTYFLTRLISKHVKVALSGDGADELFASYLAHRMAARPAGQLPLAEGDELARRMRLYLMDDQEKESFFSEKMRALSGTVSTASLVSKLFDSADTADPLNRALFVDFESLLPDQVLAFVDRLSMARSVEVRTPFLDYRLMEFAASLPGSLKIKGARTKHILKEAVKDLLPEEIIDRPKEGFVLPINDWLLDELQPFVRECLSPRRLSVHGLLQPEAVRRTLDEHYGGARQNGGRIWNLAMFQVWWERHFA